MNKNILLVSLALCASLNALSQTPSGRAFSRVGSLNELLNRVPINGETVLVETGWNTNDWGGGRLVTHFPSSSATTNLGNTWVTTNGVGRWRAQDYRAPIQDARWWTAFGTGTNDTVALQALINTQPRQISLFGTPIITQLLITNSIIIEGYGVTMYQVTNSSVATNFIQVASNTVNVIFKGITFDARNQAARGIRVDQNTGGQLLDCTFQNFQEFNVPGKITTVAFYVNGGGTEWLVDSCVFKDLTGLPDGGIGTGTGFNHGIYINREFGSGSGPASNKPKRIDVVRSKFLRILPGEDSDAIRWTDSGWVFDDINVSVDGCYFEDIGKRAFKASGSGGRFVNNIITNSFDGSVQTNGWVDVGGLKEQYSVVSLYGQNHIVANNKYNGGRIRLFFDSTINENSPLPARNEVYGNILTLSTNWGLNGLSVTNVTQGTIFGSIYLSSDVNVHDNYGEVVQFGIQVYSGSTNISIRDNHFVGLATTNNLVEASSTNGWGRGVRLGRYSTNGYPGGAVQNTIISGNYFDNFGAAIDLSETTNTFIGMNYTNRLNSPIVINETGPDSTGFWPANKQINGGNYGTITLLRQLELAYENADTFAANTNRRGGLIWDRLDQAPAYWDGAKHSTLHGATRKYQTGSLVSTNWYRVATMYDPGYTTRGSAKITIGSGGGLTTSSATFQVNNNYSDAQILMERNVAFSTASTNTPVGAVRVIRDTAGEKLHFDFQPAGALNSLVAVEVQPDWTTQAGMEPTNSWQAVQFTQINSLSGGEVQVGWISNVVQKVFAFNGDQWNWWFGPDKFVLGEAPLARFAISNSVPSTAHTPVFVLVDGALNQIMRDSTSGVLYASTYLQPYQTMKFGIGLTNVGTNISVSLAAGANVTFTTNGNTITIASTGGGGGPTNGSAVYVDSAFVTVANFIDSSELNPTYSGTNVTYSIVANSIATNKIDSTFYAWVNGKQSALTFSTGTTNSGGTITAMIAPGGGIIFTTNSQTITIASSLTFTNGLTNNNGVVTTTLLAGSNVTLSTNSVGQITIASTGGAGGSSVFVNGAFQTAPNLTNSSELSVSVAGTNVTYTIVANSIATNKIDATFYAWVNGKQSALSFTNGVTNSAGVVNAALIAGSNITLSTNAGAITIASTASGSGGLGTNIFVNNVLKQPARLTNSATVTWSVNGNGDIEAAASGVAGGYLPLSAGASYPLKDSLYFLRDSVSSEVQIVMGSGGDIANNRKYWGVESTGGIFDIITVNTNTLGVVQTYFRIDPQITDSATNIYQVGTGNNGGIIDYVLFDTGRILVKQGTLEVGSTNIIAALAGKGSVIGVNSGAGGTVTNFADTSSVTWTASSGTASAKTAHRRLAGWLANQAYHSTNAAEQPTFITRGDGIPSYGFSPTVANTLHFQTDLPTGFNLAGGLEFKIVVAPNENNPGSSNTVWQVQYQKLCCGVATVDTDSYSGATLITNQLTGVAGVATNLTFTLSSWTNFSAGDSIQIELKRVKSSASDTSTNIAALLSARLNVISQ